MIVLASCLPHGVVNAGDSNSHRVDTILFCGPRGQLYICAH